MLCSAGLRRSQATGVNWGTQLSHPLPASTVVRLLQDNGFDKVKLFDAEDAILGALKGSGIQVMVGIPNDMLADLAAGGKAAEDWSPRTSPATSATASTSGQPTLPAFVT